MRDQPFFWHSTYAHVLKDRVLQCEHSGCSVTADRWLAAHELLQTPLFMCWGIARGDGSFCLCLHCSPAVQLAGPPALEPHIAACAGMDLLKEGHCWCDCRDCSFQLFASIQQIQRTGVKYSTTWGC